jgi:cysteinyl-tRNA synthetase
MAMQYLGESIDIHGGGQDLVFPHHENEIAQSEAATGKPFVKYWIHNGLLTINEQKMAKSLGNFISLAQALRDYPGEVIRLYLLSAHYRSGLDLSSDSLARTQASLEKLYDALQRIDNAVNAEITPSGSSGHTAIEQYRRRFFQAMDDDFNTPAAIAVLFELARETMSVLSQSMDGEKQQRLVAIRHALHELGQVLGILQAPSPAMSVESHSLIEVLVEVRNILRREGNYQLADHIRTKLLDLHVVLEDTHEGTDWRIVRELEEPLDNSS